MKTDVRSGVDGESGDKPFWKTKALEELTPEEWEDLCDGCAACCVQKLEDAETGRVYVTDVACRLLDTARCRCRNYAERSRFVPACRQLTPGKVRAWHWLPESCAYRRRAAGRPLPWWHVLVCGDPEAVHRSGLSVRGRVVPEALVPPHRLTEHILGALVEEDG